MNDDTQLQRVHQGIATTGPDEQSNRVSLDTVIAGWLHAKNSERTRKAYAETLAQFRAMLQAKQLDLDAPSEQDITAIALIAQAYAKSSVTGKIVRPATIKQRCACLSSFYVYARRHHLLKENPIDLVDRPKVQAYASSQALDAGTTTEGLASIDRQSLLGKRDYALLAILLQTGRRLSEVVALDMQHVAMKQGKITLTFAHCKGDKEMRDTLPPPVSKALLTWLHGCYGNEFSIGKKDDSRPVWVSLARGTSKGNRLGIQAVADVCERYLGTSKVHATRHTYAHTMERAGASASVIQARLGHESLATTGKYLASLSQAENKYGDTIAAMIGIK